MSKQNYQGPVVKQIPEGDDRERLVCAECGFIDYQNPRIVVGAVCTWQSQILLCRRAIEPSYGKWTIPAGFMELEETVAEGAIREAREEAGIDIEIKDILGMYEVPHVGHVMIMHRAEMKSPDFKAGFESLDVKFFDYKDIPWDELAFPSVKWTLERYHEVLGQSDIPAVTESAKYRIMS